MSPVRSPYDHLVRTILRAESDAVEVADRSAQRIGDVPPTRALRAVAVHASASRERLAHVLGGHGIDACARRHRMSELCRWLIGRLVDAERAYGEALDELRREVDTVRELRAMARMDALFGVIRWCDDWLPARRRWLAQVEAQQAWFVSPGMAPPLPPVLPAPAEVGEVVTLPRFLDYL
jgi:hypothetical protein